jgi:AI-2 transport protein TqsA
MITEPIHAARERFSPTVHGLIVAAAFVIVVAGLRAAAPVLAPFTLAMFIAIISLPALRFLTRRGVPAPVAILITVLIDAAVLVVVGAIVIQAIAELRVVAPNYLLRLQALELSAITRLEALGYEITDTPLRDMANPERMLGLVTSAARRLTGILGITLLIVLYIVFMLVESVGLPMKLNQAFGHRMARLADMRRVVNDVQHYLALKTLVSVTTGVLIGAGAEIIGVDFALFWGFLAFVLNYIPTFGSLLAAIPAVAVALLQLGVGPAVALASVSLTVNVILGSILDPIIVGRRLGLSVLVALFSLVFWGWAWGLIGLFLAVPITAAAKIVMESSKTLRPIAVLLGPVPEPRS